VQRIQFCYTPKHGSWLNIAENELSSLVSALQTNGLEILKPYDRQQQLGQRMLTAGNEGLIGR
jgi:hypothetical protein